MTALSQRSARAVLDDHLRLSQSGTIEEDLTRNYAKDLVVLCTRGIYHGHEGLQQVNQFLNQELPSATFEYKTVLTSGEIGFLEWTAHAKNGIVKDGADSYLIRDGKIVAQTIHYTIEKPSQ